VPQFATVITNPDELTPVEQHDGTYYKRDDLFVPFDDVPLSGGKVRQAIKLLGPSADDIRRRLNGVVLTATGVHSPQGLIIARVAYEYGLRTVLFIGATTQRGALDRHRMLRTALRFNTTLDCSARVAYETSLTAAIASWQRCHGAAYHVKFGINLRDHSAAILGSTSQQARNIPREVETVVVPVGAGITAAGILLGVRAHCPHVRRVVLLQVAGYDRTREINAIAGWLPFEYHALTRYPYAREVRRAVAPGFRLDPIYESKAHEYMVDDLRLTGPRVLYWVVGDSTSVR